jgi:hypothetical protein
MLIVFHSIFERICQVPAKVTWQPAIVKTSLAFDFTLMTPAQFLVPRGQSVTHEAEAAYAALMDVTDWGVLYDLRRVHGMSNPSRSLLACIADLVADAGHLQIPAGVKRSRRTLIGWLNYHHNVTHAILPELVLQDTTGPLAGPRIDEWLAFQAEHPDHPAVQAINNL